jgi:hypothetical protein
MVFLFSYSLVFNTAHSWNSRSLHMAGASAYGFPINGNTYGGGAGRMFKFDT